jgi:hypothetical protein
MELPQGFLLLRTGEAVRTPVAGVIRLEVRPAQPSVEPHRFPIITMGLGRVTALEGGVSPAPRFGGLPQQRPDGRCCDENYERIAEASA